MRPFCKRLIATQAIMAALSEVSWFDNVSVPVHMATGGYRSGIGYGMSRFKSMARSLRQLFLDLELTLDGGTGYCPHHQR